MCDKWRGDISIYLYTIVAKNTHFQLWPNPWNFLTCRTGWQLYIPQKVFVRNKWYTVYKALCLTHSWWSVNVSYYDRYYSHQQSSGFPEMSTLLPLTPQNSFSWFDTSFWTRQGSCVPTPTGFTTKCLGVGLELPLFPPSHQSGRAGRGMEESKGNLDPQHLCVCCNIISPSQDNGSCFASSFCKVVFWPIPNSELYRAVYSGKKDPT